MSRIHVSDPTRTWGVPIRRPEVPEDDAKRGETDLIPQNELARCRGVEFYSRHRSHFDPASRRVNEIMAVGFYENGVLRDQIFFKDQLTRGRYTFDAMPGVPLPGSYTPLRDLIERRVQRPDYRKSFWVNSQCGTTNPVGVQTALVEGTPTSYLDAETSWTQYASDLVTGFGGVRGVNFTLFKMGHNPVFVAKIKTNTILSGTRIWAGVFSSAPAGDDGADYHAAFRYSNTAGDPGWMGSVKDGVTQKLTTNPIHPVAGDSSYLLWMHCDRIAGKVSFMVNDASQDFTISPDGPLRDNLEQSITTNLPVADINLGFAVRIQDTTLASRTIRISRVFVEHD